MTRLEKATHVSLIVLATLASVVLIADRTGVRLPQWGKQTRGQTREMARVNNIGRKLPIVEGRPAASELNVVLALRSDCPYCKASLPLYRRILELANQPSSHVGVRVVTEEDPARLREFLKSHGLGVGSISREPLAALGVVGTPTILLTDSSDTVRDELVGVLPREREDALIRDLSNGKLTSP